MKQLPYCVAWIALLVLVAPAAGAAGWSADAASRALSNYQPKQALLAAHKRLADQPGDPGARFIKAMALADTGRLDAAAAVFEKLASQYPQRERVWNNLGVLYARQGRLNKALGALGHALEVAPEDARAQENLGDVYAALADLAYRRAGRAGAGSASARKRRALEALVSSLSATLVAARRISHKKDRAPPGGRAKTAKPTPKPASGNGATMAKTRAPRLSRQIGQVLSRWANAWSHQDVSAVLSVYSDDYQPPGNTTRAEWIKHQHTQITAPKSVAVSVSHIKVQRESSDRAEATFHEHDKTPDSERDAKRHVVLVREDGDWRIVKSS